MPAATSPPTRVPSRSSSLSKGGTIPRRRLARLLLALSARPRLLNLPIHSSRHPDQPNDASHDTVHNLAGSRVALRGAGEAQTETAVDDGDGDDDAPEPDVRVGPECAAVVLFEPEVVDVAEDGLEDD